MSGHRLDRLVWRCEFGSVAPELLALELRERLQRLRDESIDVRDSATVRLWDDTLLSEYDRVFHGAARALNQRLWRPALKLIHQCERVIASMRALVQAHDDAERASAAMEQIHELAWTTCLRRLPAVTSLGQIVELAKQHIVERQFFQASCIARICIRLAEALGERRPVASAERIALQERMDAVRELCISTDRFVEGDGAEPALAGTLTTLQSLLARQYAALAVRLLSELEVQLAGRRRFFLHVRRRQVEGMLPPGVVEELRTLVSQRSWDGAVDYHWHQSIAKHAGALQEQYRRVSAVAVEIQGPVEPQEASNG